MVKSARGHLSLSARLLQAQDDERRRISRELHDSVGQSLAAAKMYLGKLDASGDGVTAQELRVLGGLIDGAIREVRTVSYLLHPAALDFYGLSSAIREYANGFSRRSAIKLRVEIPETIPRLLSEKETAVFRIVQECLTNIHRYANATNAWILISIDKVLQLEVGDDGKGLASPDLPFTPETGTGLGVGIPGMRERVRELGGTFEIQSSRKGTRVIVSVALDAEERDGTDHHEISHTTGPKRPRGENESGAAVIPGRVLIVDDHELLRRGVRTLIENEPDLEVCGEADNVVDAIQMTEELRPDVILLDLQLQSGSGWDVVREIRHFDFWTKVLMLSGHSYQYIDTPLKTSRCEGFISKSRTSSDLIQALRAVLGGKTFYPEGEPMSRTATNQAQFSDPQR